MYPFRRIENRIKEKRILSFLDQMLELPKWYRIRNLIIIGKYLSNLSNSESFKVTGRKVELLSENKKHSAVINFVLSEIYVVYFNFIVSVKFYTP